jgi:hypothetical protein
VLVDCKQEGDSQDIVRLAVVNDDGSGFHEILKGEIPVKPKANGLRFMMLWDKKRVLLGWVI